MYGKNPPTEKHKKSVIGFVEMKVDKTEVPLKWCKEEDLSTFIVKCFRISLTRIINVNNTYLYTILT